MALHPGSAELLAAVPQALRQVELCVFDASGAVEARFASPATDAAPAKAPGRAAARAARGAAKGRGKGVATAAPPPQRETIRLALPSGGTVEATFPAGEPALGPLLQTLLATLLQREQLELDMESMNSGSLQLLEQVAMLGETLPKLSAEGTDADVASLGTKACAVAAGASRAVYLRYDGERAVCEVVVHAAVSGDGQATSAPYPGARSVPVEGFLADVLRVGESAVLRSVPGRKRLGKPDSPESFAETQVLGVPVSYGSGDKRVLLGVLLLLDKRKSRYTTQQQLGSEEVQVAVSFGAMLGAVLGARKTAELGKEFALAHAIQEQILPHAPAHVRGFDLAADYRTCGDVGGDYFDYVQLADGRTMVVIADVSGHDLASGMMMVSARATLRTLAATRTSPAAVFRDLAAATFDDLTRTERFITAAAVALRPDDLSVEIANAGHADLMIYRAANNTVETVPGEGAILGFLPGAAYEGRQVKLEPGDCLLLYTDGVTETTDAADEMFGEERLAATLTSAGLLTSARAIVDAVLAAVQQFRGGHSRRDDVTAVAIRAATKHRGDA